MQRAGVLYWGVAVEFSIGRILRIKFIWKAAVFVQDRGYSLIFQLYIIDKQSKHDLPCNIPPELSWSLCIDI